MSLPRTTLLTCVLATSLFSSAGCTTDEPLLPLPSYGARPGAYAGDLHGLAGGCFVVDGAEQGRDAGALLVASGDGASFAFSGKDVASAAKLTLRPADLGTYLLRDGDGRFVVAGDAGALGRAQTLESDVTRNEDGFVSPAEWDVQPADAQPGRFVLRSHATGAYVGVGGLVTDAAGAARVAFYPSAGCAPFPELTVDATGTPTKTHFADGDLFGIVDAHEHMFTNLAFGAGGVFHGAPFHPLGVEHALGSCEPFHGADGRKDVVGYFMGGAPFDATSAAGILVAADTGSFNHHTVGYPDFVDWPKVATSTTHQRMYYRWLERAWLGGVRLMVQHATTNEVLCALAVGIHAQPQRISCNEMVSVDQILDATRALERYVDAQSGGPGRGWFRVVTTPAEARSVIGAGKLAVILGIETSNLFDCFVRARPGYPACDEATVRAKLDDYYARGVRAVFPVHKFDNAFSAGDGHRGFIEIGNMGNSGYFGNFSDVDCPDVEGGFDHGAVKFGGLNAPRDDYAGPPPVDVSGLATSPIGTLLPYLTKLKEPALPGEYCQRAGLQPLGETLLHEMMLRGMIVEVDHLPKRAYQRAYELLHAYDYPAAGTHGRSNAGDLYGLGGVSTAKLPRCQDPANPDAARAYRDRVASITAHGGYPALGVGFDSNGFAGAPGPRFGVDAGCSAAQTAGITYPFTAFGGDVSFSRPQLGNRAVDFDTEGFVHVGMLPELIEDARHIGMSDADLEPMFRSAEGYVRMWERSEARAAALR